MNKLLETIAEIIKIIFAIVLIIVFFSNIAYRRNYYNFKRKKKELVMLRLNSYNVYLEINKYVYNDTLAIIIQCSDGDVYGNLTVNIDDKLSGKNCAFIDTNNLGETILDWIVRNKLGEPTGVIGFSGFCAYPEVRFNMEEVKKYLR
jgi:cellulose synthase/poly-beta-1,6-N-acetylglucosamine synthase-like glycosyltransferase